MVICFSASRYIVLGNKKRGFVPVFLYHTGLVAVVVIVVIAPKVLRWIRDVLFFVDLAPDSTVFLSCLVVGIIGLIADRYIQSRAVGFGTDVHNLGLGFT